MIRSTVLAALLAAPPALACEPALRGDGVRLVAGERHVVAWQAPVPVPLAEFFSLEIAVCTRAGGPAIEPRLEATMPEHGHGMNYRPSIAALGAGHYRASGMLLHMPGRWTFAFSIDGETLRDTLKID